jgi:hypothetical protein
MSRIRSPNDEKESRKEITCYAQIKERIKAMNKMKFEEFTTAVVEKIREYLPESFANASVELQTITKNNEVKLTGLMIRSTESNISPAIYLEKFFDNYQSGEDMGKVLSEIAELRLQTEIKATFDTDQVTDFSIARDRIIPRLVGLEANRKVLETRPHTVIADLAVSYHILLREEADAMSSIAITYPLMESWGTNTEELHALALRNQQILLSSTFMPMSKVLGRLIGAGSEISGLPMLPVSPEDEAMYVLSNKTNTNGASALLDREIMQKVIETIGEDFFILPSSVHEVIIVPSTRDMSTTNLIDMVRDVNSTLLPPEDILSNNVYRYTLKDGLVLA